MRSVTNSPALQIRLNFLMLCRYDRAPFVGDGQATDDALFRCRRGFFHITCGYTEAGTTNGSRYLRVSRAFASRSPGKLSVFGSMVSFRPTR